MYGFPFYRLLALFYVSPLVEISWGWCRFHICWFFILMPEADLASGTLCFNKVRGSGRCQMFMSFRVGLICFCPPTPTPFNGGRRPSFWCWELCSALVCFFAWLLRDTQYCQSNCRKFGLILIVPLFHTWRPGYIYLKFSTAVLRPYKEVLCIDTSTFSSDYCPSTAIPPSIWR